MGEKMPCHISDGPSDPEDALDPIEIESDLTEQFRWRAELDDRIQEAFAIPAHLLKQRRAP